MSDNTPMRIWFHGTTAGNADQIRTVGFRPGTFFAQHLEDAIEFGGSHVFEVAFPADVASRDGWQIREDRPVSSDRIVAYYRITQKLLYRNKELRREIFESNITRSGARRRLQ